MHLSAFKKVSVSLRAQQSGTGSNVPLPPQRWPFLAEQPMSQLFAYWGFFALTCSLREVMPASQLGGSGGVDVNKERHVLDAAPAL